MDNKTIKFERKVMPYGANAMMPLTAYEMQHLEVKATDSCFVTFAKTEYGGTVTIHNARKLKEYLTKLKEQENKQE